jgi:hypothetical protein
MKVGAISFRAFVAAISEWLSVEAPVNFWTAIQLVSEKVLGRHFRNSDGIRPVALT